MKLAKVLHMQNGMVAAFDENGEQIPELQGHFREVCSACMEMADKDTIFWGWWFSRHYDAEVMSAARRLNIAREMKAKANSKVSGKPPNSPRHPDHEAHLYHKYTKGGVFEGQFWCSWCNNLGIFDLEESLYFQIECDGWQMRMTADLRVIREEQANAKNE